MGERERGKEGEREREREGERETMLYNVTMYPQLNELIFHLLVPRNRLYLCHAIVQHAHICLYFLMYVRMYVCSHATKGDDLLKKGGVRGDAEREG